MATCTHHEIELHEVLDDDMHCSGWGCLDCDHLATGECHHRTWCRQDFCGAEPLVLVVRQPALVGV